MSVGLVYKVGSGFSTEGVQGEYFLIQMDVTGCRSVPLHYVHLDRCSLSGNPLFH